MNLVQRDRTSQGRSHTIHSKMYSGVWLPFSRLCLMPHSTCLVSGLAHSLVQSAGVRINWAGLLRPLDISVGNIMNECPMKVPF